MSLSVQEFQSIYSHSEVLTLVGHTAPKTFQKVSEIGKEYRVPLGQTPRKTLVWTHVCTVVSERQTFPVVPCLPQSKQTGQRVRTLIRSVLFRVALGHRINLRLLCHLLREFCSAEVLWSSLLFMCFTCALRDGGAYSWELMYMPSMFLIKWSMSFTGIYVPQISHRWKIFCIFRHCNNKWRNAQ